MMSPFRTSLRNLLAIGLLLAVSGQAQADFSARAVYRSASPSVVVIYGLDASGNGSSGTGSIITPDGKILTNNHVIFDANRNAPYEHLVVFFKPAKVTGDLAVDLKTQYRVKILGRDPTGGDEHVDQLGAPVGREQLDRFEGALPDFDAPD